MASNQVIILTIDGGGIRGIIPAYILDQIEQATHKYSCQLFDIIGGTSTGGIITAGLTSAMPGSSYPFKAAALLSMYKNNGAKIFVAQDSYVEPTATYYGDDGNGNGIEPYLQSLIGATQSLTDAQAAMKKLGARVRQVFTTGYIVSSTGGTVTNPKPGVDYGPYLFNWNDAAQKGDNYYVWEAARATSAAPVYFPVACVGGSQGDRSGADQRWVIDGGTMSNNPAVWGITEAFRLGYAKQLSDITVISLGTGVYAGSCGVGIHTNYYDGTPDDGNWGKSPWIGLDMHDLEYNKSRGLLLNIILNAVQLVSCNQLTAMQKGGLNYYRLEPEIPLSLDAMDNITSKNINDLTQAADDYIKGPGAPIFKKVVSLLQASIVMEPEVSE